MSSSKTLGPAPVQGHPGGASTPRSPRPCRSRRLIRARFPGFVPVPSPRPQLPSVSRVLARCPAAAARGCWWAPFRAGRVGRGARHDRAVCPGWWRYRPRMGTVSRCERRCTRPLAPPVALARRERAAGVGRPVMVSARRCSRPACKHPAVYTLTYVYRDSTAVLGSGRPRTWSRTATTCALGARRRPTAPRGPGKWAACPPESTSPRPTTSRRWPTRCVRRPPARPGGAGRPGCRGGQAGPPPGAALLLARRTGPAEVAAAPAAAAPGR